MRKPSALLLVTILLTSCANFRDVTFHGVRNVELRKMNGNDIALTIEAEVENPNNYRIKLKDPDVDLWYNGQFVGKAVLDSTVVLDKRSTRIYPVYISADTQGKLGPILLGGLGSLLSGQAELRASGTVKGQVGIISKRFPFDIRDTLELR
ncbi:MAG: LEA type 2 family protein [Flavobacteriales bacterium]|nr:LEA type 2 family protein [Flavobacteriales bacterium]MBK7554923.1 LEA type 2 family protein [Flavobacteriales bacterium]MBK9194706.1 LEA type 2 family protein [Flavobacteriales bacterium]MBP6573611.1 LEA type 2 family protein [Flavobacteriales bacterium]